MNVGKIKRKYIFDKYVHFSIFIGFSSNAIGLVQEPMN